MYIVNISKKGFYLEVILDILYGIENKKRLQYRNSYFIGFQKITLIEFFFGSVIASLFLEFGGPQNVSPDSLLNYT